MNDKLKPNKICFEHNEYYTGCVACQEDMIEHISILQAEIDRLKKENDKLNAELVEAISNAIQTFEYLIEIAHVQTKVINPEFGQSFTIENDVSLLADICNEVGEFKGLLAKARGQE